MPAIRTSTSRRVTPIQGTPLPIKPAFGHNTLEFFTEGEQHERQNWEDVVLPTEEAERLQPNPSFDKVPREKSAIFLLVLLGGGLVAGVVFGVREWAKTGWKVDSSANSMSSRPLPGTPSSAPIAPPSPEPTPLASPEGVKAAEPTAEDPPPREAVEAANVLEVDGVNKPRAEARAEDRRLPQPATPDSQDRPKAKAKIERSKSKEPASNLDRQAEPETSGSVVPAAPLENPAQIEPPRAIVAPEEAPVPNVRAETNPFEL